MSQDPIPFVFGDIVSTPLGKGRIEGLYLPRSGDSHPDGLRRYLIVYGRNDFPQEVWRASFSVLNAPSVSRVFTEADIEILERAPRTREEAWAKRDRRQRENLKSSENRAPSERAKIAVENRDIARGQLWKSQKGYVFRVEKVVGDKISLRQVDYPYSRDTTAQALLSRYSLVERQE